MSPQTLGRYKIIAELGRGAMGTVYHGIDPTIERPVAIKILNPDLPEEVLDEVKSRFLREAKSAGKLNHPNIVTVYEFGEAEGIAFLAMEYLEGKSLHQVIRGERLPYTTIATTIAQIADGLDYAHRFGVVHRDIKPANIMVSPHGLAKLTDFGIAHVQSSTMTGAGAMLGSPKYMAPEYVLGKQIDGRADIFSLGIVLYEMLTGRTPFEEGESSTIFSTMQRIVTAQPKPLSEIAPHIPPAFDLILARALAKKADDRYQRASQFANDLRNFKSLMQANGEPQADITAIVNRPTYAEEVKTAAVPPAPGEVHANAHANAPANAPAAATTQATATDNGAPAQLSAWERAAAFLGRKSSLAPPITPPSAVSAAIAATAAAKQAARNPPAQMTPPGDKPTLATDVAPPAGIQAAPAEPANSVASAASVAPSATSTPPAPTMPQQAPSRFDAGRPKSVASEHGLLGDLDALSSTLDEMQRKFIAEEAEAMTALRKAAPRAKDWDNIVEGMGEFNANAPLAGEAASGTKPGGGDAARASGVFGLLRQQAAPGLKNQATARRDAEAQAMLSMDAKLSAGYQFLLEFCRELNASTPVYAGEHTLLFYGPCPPLLFSEVSANARTNRVDDRGKIRDVVDHLLVSYYLTSPDPGRNTVTAVELPTFKAILEQHEMKHEFQEVKSDFGQVLRATFNFEFKFICSFTLRANYAEGNAEIVCRNVGPLGRLRYVVPVAALEISFFEELSKLMLGFPNQMTAYAVTN